MPFGDGIVITVSHRWRDRPTIIEVGVVAL
jgi:hypothetical protein